MVFRAGCRHFSNTGLHGTFTQLQGTVCVASTEGSTSEGRGSDGGDVRNKLAPGWTGLGLPKNEP